MLQVKHSSRGSHLKKSIAVIGAGAIGISTAWHLTELGNQVILLDPCLNQPIKTGQTPLNGSCASLGVLMGNIFRRSTGRAWKLRQRSMELWPSWINQLNTFQNELIIQTR